MYFHPRYSARSGIISKAIIKVTVQYCLFMHASGMQCNKSLKSRFAATQPSTIRPTIYPSIIEARVSLNFTLFASPPYTRDA